MTDIGHEMSLIITDNSSISIAAGDGSPTTYVMSYDIYEERDRVEQHQEFVLITRDLLTELITELDQYRCDLANQPVYKIGIPFPMLNEDVEFADATR